MPGIPSEDSTVPVVLVLRHPMILCVKTNDNGKAKPSLSQSKQEHHPQKSETTKGKNKKSVVACVQ
jgi:hypothetical protein